MRMNASFARSAHLVAAIAAVVTTGLSAQAPPPDLHGLLEQIGRRIEAFYRRAQSVMCEEKVVAQPIRHDMTLDGFARVLEYDLRVEMATLDDAEAGDANFVRELRKVNGRAPRPKDANSRDTCMDPNPLTPEPLAFLLARNREKYAFKWVGYGKGRDANTLLIDFRELHPDKPEFIDDKRGRDGCFSMNVPIDAGRVWVDARTYDVLRVDQTTTSRVEIRVPARAQRHLNVPDVIVIDRFQLVTRYRPVVFTDPEETLLLPASIEEVAVLRGAQSNRKTQVFSNYKRFLTGGRIVKNEF